MATLSAIFSISKRRYVFFLCDKSVGNLTSQETREVVTVSTCVAWGCYVHIFFQRSFLPPYHRDVDIQHHAFNY